MNQIRLIGTVSDIQFSHSFFGKDMYECYVSSKRLSGAVDKVHCIIPGKFAENINDGDRVDIDGTVRTRNYDGKDGKRHLGIFVFAENVFMADEEDMNIVTGNGFVCKMSEKRTTPLTHREIIDFLVAIHRKESKGGTFSDYIPCIAWEGVSKKIDGIAIGTEIDFTGRLQSRIYAKEVSEGVYEEMTAYELSLSDVEVKEDNRNGI